MASSRKTRFQKLVWVGIFLFLAMAILSLFVGNSSASTKELVQALFGVGAGRKATSLILFQVRLPRTLSGVLCGVALSASGMLLQTALDNSLCSPGTMGINAGAGVFVLISGILFPFSAISKQIFGFLGAICATLMIYAVCRFAGFSKSTLILTGVAISSLFTAGSNAIITLRPDAVVDKTAFSLGGLSGATWSSLAAATPWVVLGLAVVFVKADHFGLLRLGDDSAAGLGVRASDMRRLALVISAVLAGSAVSICGMLGFVGLIVPNLIRKVGNFGVRQELLLCCLYAGSFLLACDMLARYLFFPYELPVGLILSLLGSPFFLYILVKRKRSVLS